MPDIEFVFWAGRRDRSRASLLDPAACIVHAMLGWMGRPLQIRNVPEPVLRTLRERADEARMSLAAYALEILTDHVATKSMRQVLSGPRLRRGRLLADREIVDLIEHGRR